MSRKQIPMYATKNDFAAVFRGVSLERPIDFVATGLFDKAEMTILHESDDIASFSAYMAFDRGLSIEQRVVPQRDGTTKFAIDPMINKKTIIFRCGGLIGNERLVAGDIAASDTNEQSEEIYRLFVRHIMKNFKKVKSYYVGPEAMDLFDQGIRLSPSEKSPELYDLKR